MYAMLLHLKSQQVIERPKNLQHSGYQKTKKKPSREIVKHQENKHLISFAHSKM